MTEILEPPYSLPYIYHYLGVRRRDKTSIESSGTSPSVILTDTDAATEDDSPTGSFQVVAANGNTAMMVSIDSGHMYFSMRDQDGTMKWRLKDGTGLNTRMTLTAAGLLEAVAFKGPLSGNADTATALETARTINGVSFNGTANITVTAAAGTLSGSTLASGVTASSLTSLGTLTSLTVSSTSSVVGMILDGTTHPAITLKGGGTIRGYIGIATANAAFVNNSVTGDVVVRSDGGTALHLGTTSGAAALTIAGANVGIGTISPVCALSVTSGATNSSAHFGRYDDEGLFLHSDAGSGNYNWRVTTQTVVDQGFEIAPSTAVGGQTWDTPVFVIKVDGKVGIGTTAPAYPLTIADGTGIVIGDYTSMGRTSSGAMSIFGHNVHVNTAVANQVLSTNSGYYGQMIKMYYNQGITFHAVNATVTAGNAFFTEGGTTNEVMRITNAGRLGVNRTAPAALVHIQVTDGWDSGDYALRVDNLEATAAEGNGIQVQAGSGAASSYPMFLWNNSAGPCFYVRDDARSHFYGTVSKGGGSFDIAHPTKGGDWRLRHSFIEGPQADNIYRGTVTLSGGTATVDLDAVSNMTDGTWEALNRDPWVIAASSGNVVEWLLSGKMLTITSDTADAVCSWMVIGERQDDFMKSSQGEYADDDGHLIVEYEEAQPLPPVTPEAAVLEAGIALEGT